MKWYSAHMVMWFELKDDQTQDVFTLYENVVLVRGDHPDEVREKADAMGKLEESFLDDTLTLDGRPAVMRFGGVRKIVECQWPIECIDESCPIVERTEVTYSEITVRGRANLDKLIAGECVAVLYD